MEQAEPQVFYRVRLGRVGHARARTMRARTGSGEPALSRLLRDRGMTHPTKPHAPLLPHHKLVAYGVAVELLLAVKAANIRDAKLRDEAVRAAKGTCLNCAEGAGRASRADKARVFDIARGEAVKAIAAVEIAAHAGDTAPEHAQRCAARSPPRRTPHGPDPVSPPARPRPFGVAGA